MSRALVQDSPEGGAGRNRLSLNDRLALISLIDEGLRVGSVDSPLADVFSDLGDLVGATVSGAKIDRLSSEDGGAGFKVFEINAETGENLGRLTLLYLKKPIPCYYLVYVEVAPPFRNQGLGNRVLSAFRSFLIQKSAVGILDNIIPDDDPTYDIYGKLEWKPVQSITGMRSEGDGVYMVFIPPAMEGKDLKDPVIKLLHHLRRKRASIDMRDNEQMVKRTIEEFQDLYSALVTYFDRQEPGRENDLLKRFMFTRFVTKLLGFRRRIAELLGYTGGESLEQIVLHEAVRSLTIQSYAPRALSGESSFNSGDRELWLNLPEELKNNPAREIEALPNYRRPKLSAWIAEKSCDWESKITIGDLLVLGFDPTRLKEITIHGEPYIFERMQARLLSELEARMQMLAGLAPENEGTRVRNAELRINPPLLIIRDRGNAYALRRKIEGIHWEEAVEQLQTRDHLRALNKSMSVDKLIKGTVRRTQDWLFARTDKAYEAVAGNVSYFVSWQIEANQPKVVVDFSGTCLETIWIA